ncbi:MAG: hydantoinase B/oxoprolinase family protein [Rhizobiaceae bacterium]|nr:hydantoinase B/oxoprolinase family protein [Rhizobiaceae bacterium]
MRKSDIAMQIMWSRLATICEEQAQVMLRAAFSAAVRESGDLSAGLFDIEGRMLAQAVTGTPGHVNTMASAVVHFLRKFPPQTMRPGDAFVTNDPWLASGHLHDVTVVTPAFLQGSIVGLFAATVHLVDIGGRGFGPDARDLYEEGIQVPHMYLVREGVVNEVLMELMRANSREPQQVEGDIYAIVAAGEEGARRLSEVMTEFGESSLGRLGAHILEQTEKATRKAISQLPDGVYRNHTKMDGYESPIDLRVAMHVSNGSIHLDFEGTSGISSFGINCPLPYTQAYSFYAIKCVVAPDIPSNHGAHEPFSISAPDNTIVNPLRPAAVAARHVVGHMLPDLILGCLAQAMKGQVPAESGMMWNPTIRGYRDFAGNDRMWEYFCLFAAGMGARPKQDGLDGTAFPSALKSIPVESLETGAPLVVWKKELRPDSGGAGEFRGGMGQILEIGALGEVPLRFQAMFERVTNAARGRDGGSEGACGKVSLSSGKQLRSKGQQDIPLGDCIVLELPGGGGYGDPSKRSLKAIAKDVRNGLLTEEAARAQYPHYAGSSNA